MKKTPFTTALFGVSIICSSFFLNAQPSNPLDLQLLKNCFEAASYKRSDINEHVPVLANLSKECSSVTEIGVRSMESSWGILYGLAQSASPERSYLGIDLNMPPAYIYLIAKECAKQNGIHFNFLQANDMTIEIDPVDMLFIDSLHTYCHLTYELEKFSPKVNKYIAMHDTSPPWENRDDQTYYGNYSEYPQHIDRNKRGLWPAVEDFLKNHPEWTLLERRFNNHGFTVLKRVSPN